MRLGAVLSGALTGLLLVGCAHAHARQEEADVARRLAYVDELKGPAIVRRGAAATFTLVGSLPDPSWELVGVEQVREGRRVRLSPWLRRTTDDPVMQVLVPFERKVVLEKLAPGRWEVQALGFGDATATAALEVRP